MLLSGMLTLLEFYIDDVADQTDAILLFNQGKNKMATAMKAKFPDIVANGQLDDKFVFDEEYHETPVLYAAAMYKANDSSLGEKRDYMGDFMNGVSEFTENYDLPAQYRNDILCQQFKAASAQTDFVITKEGFSPVNGNLKVYLNSQLTDQYNFNTSNNTIMFYTGLSLNDAVTAVWEDHAELENPPWPWQKDLGW